MVSLNMLCSSRYILRRILEAMHTIPIFSVISHDCWKLELGVLRNISSIIISTFFISLYKQIVWIHVKMTCITFLTLAIFLCKYTPFTLYLLKYYSVNFLILVVLKREEFRLIHLKCWPLIYYRYSTIRRWWVCILVKFFPHSYCFSTTLSVTLDKNNPCKRVAIETKFPNFWETHWDSSCIHIGMICTKRNQPPNDTYLGKVVRKCEILWTSYNSGRLITYGESFLFINFCSTTW